MLEDDRDSIVVPEALAQYAAGFDLANAYDLEGHGFSLAPASAYNWGLPLFEKDERLPAPVTNPYQISFAPRPFTFDQPNAGSAYQLPVLPGLPGLPPPSAVDSPAAQAPFDSYSDFFNFDDAADLEECPGLEDDLGDDDVLSSLLFPSATGTSADAAPKADVASLALDNLDVKPASSKKAPSSTPKPRVRGPSTRATGFRGASTKLVPLDAPIQGRHYHIPSATSKKRKTTAVERALLKRQCGDTPVPADLAATPASEDEEEIPDDLLAAAERKRLCNTLAARKSRARKQGRLAQLEGENQTLVAENEKLKKRVDELELLLRGVGLEA
ncbi:hypothetical protein RQP46_003857 [Phenoliferia psychrophenolica]